jgi:hypothetical protein
MKKLICLFIVAIFISGCASTQTYGAKNLSQDLIKESIIKGKTTKEEVRKLLGNPTSAMITDYNMPKVNLPKYGESGIVGSQQYDMSNVMPYETWTYSKIELHKVGLTPKGFLYYSTTGSLFDRRKTTSLSVCFDKNGVVSSYTFIEL